LEHKKYVVYLQSDFGNRKQFNFKKSKDIMAHHQSAKKRIRQTETKRLHNKYYARTTRNAVRDLRALSNKTEAEEMLPKVAAMLDKLAKKNIIHANKAANLKSSLTKHVNALA
jgi:small subunit ribosomal protein S20